jgi:hypothetical protein
MKAFKAIFLLVFVSGMLVHFNGIAQAVKTVESDIEITLRNPVTEETYYLVNGEGVTIETESGNLLKKVSFKLDETHPLMDFEGPNLFIAISIKKDNILIVRDELAVLTRSGNLKFTFHINGSGIKLPVGWVNK